MGLLARICLTLYKLPCSCTKDTCNPISGECKYEPLANCCSFDYDCVKLDDLCQDGTCREGKCEYQPKKCNDGDMCTMDSCEDGECKYEPKNCDDKNECTHDSCDLVTGECKHDHIVCDDGLK